MTVEFIFCLDDKVRTPFNEPGIVTMLGFDEAGKQYYVRTRVSSSWYKEAQLTDQTASL